MHPSLTNIIRRALFLITGFVGPWFIHGAADAQTFTSTAATPLVDKIDPSAQTPPGMVWSDIEVPGSVPASSVVVQVDLSHGRAGDLAITLRHTRLDGTTPVTRDLVRRLRRGSAGVGSQGMLGGVYVFDDASPGDLWAFPTTPGSIPAGSYFATSSRMGMAGSGQNPVRVRLSDLLPVGDAGGLWTLTIADHQDQFTGTLNGWSLTFGASASPELSGACCIDTDCYPLVQADCANMGGTWAAGFNCMSTCTWEILGSCCTSDGSCALTTQTRCTAEGGLNFFPVAPCALNACVDMPGFRADVIVPSGSCRAGNGSCGPSTLHDCFLASGTYFAGSDCDDPGTPPDPNVNMMQLGRLLPTEPIFPYYFGAAIALSADGQTLAVGGDNNNGLTGAYIFDRSGNAWTQSARLGPTSLPANGMNNSVAINADGTRVMMLMLAGVAVFDRNGASWAYSPWLPLGGKTAQNFAMSADGRVAAVNAISMGTQQVYLYEDLGTWQEVGSVPMAGGLALSADGGTLVVSSGTGVHVFTRNAGAWIEDQQLLPQGPAQTGFGTSIAVSGDGSTIIVGANFWAFFYGRSGGAWIQEGVVQAQHMGMPASDWSFGYSVALNNNGSRAAVGAFMDSNYTGAVYLFTRSGGAWSQSGNRIVGLGGPYNPAAPAKSLGQAISMSADGQTLAAGAPTEGAGAGAAYVFCGDADHDAVCDTCTSCDPEPPSPETTRIRDLMAGYTDGDIGLYLRRIGDTAPLAAWRDSIEFEPCSMIKIVHAAYTMQRVEQGVYGLTDGINLYGGYDTSQSPSCPGYSDPQVWSLQDVINQMMVNSDNRATQALRVLHGESIMNAWVASLGMAHTRLNHRIGCPEAAQNPNRFTLVDAGNIYQKIHDGTLFSGATRDTLFGLMLNTQVATITGIIDAEGAAAGLTAGEIASFKASCAFPRKAGSYGLWGGSAFYFHQTRGGLAYIPVRGAGATVTKDVYVQGTYVQHASADVPASTAATIGYYELLREPIRESMATWRAISDFNGTSGTTVQDLFDYLGAWFDRTGSADTNATGTITVQDLFDFLVVWFART